jgi:hypothetical protein
MTLRVKTGRSHKKTKINPTAQKGCAVTPNLCRVIEKQGCRTIDNDRSHAAAPPQQTKCSLHHKYCFGSRASQN